MAVPNIFGSATAAIPLSQLDQNFATAITLGNTAVYLGNTTTSLGNVTLTNVTISSGTSNIAANVSAAVGLLPEANGGTGTTTGYYGFKNRIINGAMTISQRNGTSTVTPGSTDYLTDRWHVAMSQSSKFTGAQSSTAPTGFSNSLIITSSSAYSVLSTDYFVVRQAIEGFNFADCGFGTASASTTTLSFWVRSSLTGAFGGSLYNAAGNRSYPFSYTINAANTFEQKTITIAGDTTGTWVGATNGAGIYVSFSLGAGSTFNSPANAWAGGFYTQPSGSTSVVGTSGATWYVTGVQLEKGSTATSFDYRPYGTELALCQRYFEKSDNQATAILTNSRQTVSVREATNIPDQVPIGQQIFYAVTKRASGTVTTYPFTTASNINRVSNGSGADYGASSGLAGGLTDAGFYVYNGSGGTLTVSANQTIIFNWYSSAEL